MVLVLRDLISKYTLFLHLCSDTDLGVALWFNPDQQSKIKTEMNFDQGCTLWPFVLYPVRDVFAERVDLLYDGDWHSASVRLPITVQVARF
jgi:hypothetical protein